LLLSAFVYCCFSIPAVHACMQVHSLSSLSFSLFFSFYFH
jgi:hypothetical protein